MCTIKVELADGVDELCGSTSSAERSAVGARQRVGYVASMGATDALTATDVLKRRAAALQRILGLMIMRKAKGGLGCPQQPKRMYC